VTAHPIHHEAAVVLGKLGGDASDFAARQLTPRIASEADLVIAMTMAHRDRVLELAPHLLNRTFTLSEASRLVSECQAQTVADLASFRSQLAAHERPDIRDPIGQSAEVFAAVGSEIADLLAPVLELCRRSSTATVDRHQL
jgi:low molecular weight protein-tyrosine phosphatase